MDRLFQEIAVFAPAVVFNIYTMAGMIWVDGLNVVPTPSYHVQRLFAHNHGDRVLPVTLGELTPAETKRVYASATMENSGTVIVKLVNGTDAPSSTRVALAGVASVGAGTRTVLSGPADAVNSFTAADRIAPQTSSFVPANPTFDVVAPAQSFVILRLPVK